MSSLYNKYRIRLEQHILKWTAEYFGLKAEELSGPRRLRKYVTARHNMTNYMWKKGYRHVEIADLLNRDRTTIIYYMQLHRDLMSLTGKDFIEADRYERYMHERLKQEIQFVS